MIAPIVAMLGLSTMAMDYRSQKGLSITVADVPAIQGSFFQVYAPGWTRSYYSSTWNSQTIESTGDGRRVHFKGSDGRLEGEILLKNTQLGIRSEYRFLWSGNEPANLEASFAHLWAPAFSSGTLAINGSQPIALPPSPDKGVSMAERWIGTGKTFRFMTSWGVVLATVIDASAVLLDARNYDQDFAADNDLFWFGVSDLPLPKGAPVRFAVEWTFEPMTTSSGLAQKDLLGNTGQDHPAFGPFQDLLAGCVPKEAILGRGAPWRLGKLDARLHPLLPRLSEIAHRRWSGWKRAGSDPPVIEVKDIGLKPGGYRLSSKQGRLHLIGQDWEGLRNSIERTGQLLRPEEDHLVIPCMEMTDEPEISWRGVHAFIGPQAKQFQGMLVKRLWRPLMLNNVVLQCERTQWDATPHQKGGITTSKTDLKALAEQYRSAGIEVTPLIQSFGHMEWLFAGGANMDLAFNREVPYSVDPRKPGSAEILKRIWTEAAQLLTPKTIHFGLDEVDMRGWPEDPQLVTNLWAVQIPILSTIAKELRARMMVWGDHLLAPGEAPDAMNGNSKAHAKQRRDALPRDAVIADWHYKNDANPEIYTSLELFKREGLDSIASTWHRTENIKGFFLAAAKNGSGALQTTWAGYESKEENMLREGAQYRSWAQGPLVAWRPTQPAPNTPEVLRRYVYEPAIPISAVGGASVGGGKPVQLGPYRVCIGLNQRLRSVLTEAGSQSPQVLSRSVGRRVSGAVFALRCENRVASMTELAIVKAHFSDGTAKSVRLYYGADLTAASDSAPPIRRPSRDGVAAIHIALDEKEVVESIELTAISPIASLSLEGLTLLNPIKRP